MPLIPDFGTRRSPRFLQAFTRIELLAVTAGVALLAPLLSGAVQARKMRATVCMANLRELAKGMALYADDNHGYFPGNVDDGSSGRNWVAGNAAFGGRDFTNTAILIDSGSSLMSRYLNGLPSVYRCPANRLSHPSAGLSILQARNYSLNGAVGTHPSGGGKLAVDGPWLDGLHAHMRGRTWHTYAGPSSVTVPSPSELFTFLDEEPYSVNDGSFGMTMASAEWLDWPATHHEGGGIFAFVDLHVDHHRWRDPRTRVTNGVVTRRAAPNSPDHLWLQQRTSARIQK